MASFKLGIDSNLYSPEIDKILCKSNALCLACDGHHPV